MRAISLAIEKLDKADARYTDEIKVVAYVAWCAEIKN